MPGLPSYRAILEMLPHLAEGRNSRCPWAMEQSSDGSSGLFDTALTAENIYTIPNILTFSRLIAAPVIGYLILHEQHLSALALFVYAGATDLVDGWIARRWNLQTVVGSVIDPMADKTLMTVLTVALAMQGAMPLPLAVLILGRDILLSLAAIYYRYISLPPPKTLARYWDFSLPSAEVHPTGISKVNTALQLGLIGWTMGTMAIGGDLGWWGPEGALRAMCSLLGIEDITSTLPPATSRTTTTTVIQSVTTLPSTVTVAQVTNIITVTSTAGHILRREKDATITSIVDVQPQPYAYNPVPSMLADADRNASIAAEVTSACSCLSLKPKTVSSRTTTRTIEGEDVSGVPAATITSGTTVLTVTQTALVQPTYPIFNTSLSKNTTSSTRASLTAPTSPSLSSAYPTGTSPSKPLNTTSLLPPYPTTNITLPSAPLPTSPPISYNTTSTRTSTLTASNLTTSTSTSSLRPVGTSVAPAGCPSINNTIYTIPTGEQYQLQCYRSYSGPVYIGLDKPYFRDCIQECSTVNAGFSATRCYGVTWLKYAQGIHCNLKSQASLANYTTDYESVSAVLLSGVPPPVVGAFPNATGGVSGARVETTGGQVGLEDWDPLTWREGQVGGRRE
ncbi:MAG: hypothetical protein Q9220_006463 [cf. Caloplaca sp. 1 TL-2023]